MQEQCSIHALSRLLSLAPIAQLQSPCSSVPISPWGCPGHNGEPDLEQGPTERRPPKPHLFSNWNGLWKRNRCALGQANGWLHQQGPQRGTASPLTDKGPLAFQNVVIFLQGNPANLFNHLQCYHVFVKWKFSLGSMWQNADCRRSVAHHQEAGWMSGSEMWVPRLTVPIGREQRETVLRSCRLHTGRGGLMGAQVLSENLQPPNTAEHVRRERARWCPLVCNLNFQSPVICKMGTIISALPPSESHGMDETVDKRTSYKPQPIMVCNSTLLISFVAFIVISMFILLPCLMSVSASGTQALQRQESSVWYTQ